MAIDFETVNRGVIITTSKGFELTIQSNYDSPEYVKPENAVYISIFDPRRNQIYTGISIDEAKVLALALLDQIQYVQEKK